MKFVTIKIILALMKSNYIFKDFFLTFYVFTMFNSSSRKNEYNEILFTTLLHNNNLDTKAAIGQTRHNMNSKETIWRGVI